MRQYRRHWGTVLTMLGILSLGLSQPFNGAHWLRVDNIHFARDGSLLAADVLGRHQRSSEMPDDSRLAGRRGGEERADWTLERRID